MHEKSNVLQNPQSQLGKANCDSSNHSILMSPPKNPEKTKVENDPFSECLSSRKGSVAMLPHELRTLDPVENNLHDMGLTPPPEFLDNLSWN